MRVVAEGGEEVDRVGELRELHGGDRPSSGGLLPGLLGVDDLTRARHCLDRDELDPLDVADDSSSHPRHAHRSSALGR